MKKSILILTLIIMAIGLQAQNVPMKFRVNFTDKNNSPYTIGNPSQYLSPQALQRRTNQRIAIVDNDIPVNPWYVDSVRKTGAQVYTISKWFNCVTVYTQDMGVLTKISALPFVSGIDTLADMYVKTSEKPKKKHGGKQGSQSLSTTEPGFFDEVQNCLNQSYMATNNLFNYGFAYDQVHMLGTDSLHGMGFRGQNMTIAVLDAGFYRVDSVSVFDSLWQNHQILGTKNFVQPGVNVFDKGTHGMMVMSIMGGNSPGKIIGTAPKAKYWLLQSEDPDTEYPVEEDNWVSAAEFADSVGADIINSSLGYTEFFNTKWNHTYKDLNGNTCRSSKGAVIAASKGILVCNSAGNSGNGTWHYIGAPADADHIITVGSVDAKGKSSDFSSRGPTYDGRIKPTVCAMGEGTFVTTTTGSVMSGNGTSFSSPVMAGSVACLWQANLMSNNADIIEALTGSANHYKAPDASYGYGIPNLVIANMILHGSRFQDFDRDNSMDVFPNPITDNFNIVFYSSDTSAIDVQLYDLSGRMVYSKEKVSRTPGCNSIQINGIGTLSKGYYMLKVISDKQLFSLKLLKAQ